MFLSTSLDISTSNFNNIRFVDGTTFTTIQAAIDNIASATGEGANNPGTGGAMVLVPPGVYSESITLKSNVRVVGYGASTVIRATGAGVTIVKTAPGNGTRSYRTGLENVVLDGNGLSSVIALDVVDTFNSHFSNIQALRGGTSGTAFRLRVSATGNDNTGTNTFLQLFAHSWGTGLVLNGLQAGSGGEVTLNTFSGLHLAACITRGIEFVKYADTNVFLNARMGIQDGGTGVEFNTDAPTLSRDVVRNNFYNLAIDGSGTITTGVTALKYNFSTANRIYGFVSTLSTPSTNINIADVGANNNLIDDSSLNALPFAVPGFNLETDLQLLPLSNANAVNSNNINLISRNSGGTLKTSLINSTVGGGEASLQLRGSSVTGHILLLSRLRSATTAQVTGDYALGGNWGTTPSVSSVAATDHGGRVTVTSGSGAPGANPTITLTFKDGSWVNPPGIGYGRGDINSPTTAFWALTSVSATAATWTFVGTPDASTNYVLDFVAMGR